MEINYQTIKNDCVQMVARGQNVVRTDIDVQDRGGAEKLLSVGVDATVTSVEAVVGSAHVYGRVTYKILYLDAEGKTCGLDYFGDFDFIVEDEAIAVGVTTATANILDSDCTLTSGVMHLEAVCEACLMQIVSHEADVVTHADCECLEGTVHTLTLAPIAESVFDVVEEVESHVGIDRVLLFDAKALHTATKTGVDSTTVEGKVYAKIIYRTQGEIRTQDVVFDFAEQLDIEGDVDLSLSVKQARLVLTGEDDNTVLRIEMTICARGNRMIESDCTAVLDAYVPGCDVKMAGDAFTCRRFVALNSRSERISARLDVADIPLNAEIAAATVARVNIANWIAGDGQVTVEGLAVAGVLYRGEDGLMQATEVELPFSVTFADQVVSPDCTLMGEVMEQGIAVSKSGLVEMDLLFAVKCYRPEIMRYTTSIETQEVERADAVMSVYFAPENATLWDIARAVHVSPSALLKQNPQIEEIPTDGGVRRIVVFRHRELE